jgi:hypothetical protein
MARPVHALALFLAAGALLAGCSVSADDVDAKNAYARAVNAAQDRFLRSEHQVQAEITTATSTRAQDQRALDQLAAAVDRAVADLRAISPPAAVQELHRRLVAALAAYLPAIALRRAVSRNGDARSLISASTRFAGDSEQVNARVARAITAINAKLSG